MFWEYVYQRALTHYKIFIVLTFLHEDYLTVILTYLWEAMSDTLVGSVLSGGYDSSFQGIFFFRPLPRQTGQFRQKLYSGDSRI